MVSFKGRRSCGTLSIVKGKMLSTKGLEPGEILNGWTKPLHDRYMQERDRAFSDRINGENKGITFSNPADYDPHNF